MNCSFQHKKYKWTFSGVIFLAIVGCASLKDTNLNLDSTSSDNIVAELQNTKNDDGKLIEATTKITSETELTPELVEAVLSENIEIKYFQNAEERLNVLNAIKERRGLKTEERVSSIRTHSLEDLSDDDHSYLIKNFLTLGQVVGRSVDSCIGQLLTRKPDVRNTLPDIFHVELVVTSEPRLGGVVIEVNILDFKGMDNVRKSPIFEESPLSKFSTFASCVESTVINLTFPDLTLSGTVPLIGSFRPDEEFFL